MSHADFLFELGCEELPTSALKKAGKDLQASIEKRLNEAGLEYQSIRGIASPRRLGVLVENLTLRQADQTLKLRGPSKAVAYKDGAPTPALLGFCRKQGIEPNDLVEVETPKGIWLEFNGIKAGQETRALLPSLLTQAVDQLPLPKRMRWGSTRAEFTRPVLWLVALLGDEVLDLTLFDRTAGRQTRGHRVHSPDFITIESPARYFDQLREQRVIADFAERRGRVRELAQSLATDELIVVTDDDLVDEVAALVEWPVPLMGKFDPAFLDVPEEALVSSMKEHQKYFHVKHLSGSLAPHFVTMANLESKEPDLVIAGNERVLNARLADAKFFWDTDLKTPLADRMPKLDNIVFHELLGTLGDKTRRAGLLARAIAPSFGVDAEQAAQASALAKCDLLSEMVLEFSDLQGLMGTYYARHEGYPSAIAESLVEVYKPAGAADQIPATPLGCVIAIADKLDTLVGLFAVGQPPTGSKDPFALRRAALGILRIVMDHELSVDLAQWVAHALTALDTHVTQPDAHKQVTQFLNERLKVVLSERGVTAEMYSAITAATSGINPGLITARCAILGEQLGGDDLLAVAAGAKRVNNLLAKAAGTSQAVDPSLCSEPAEQHLLSAIDRAEKALSDSGDDYALSLATLAELRDPIDSFFESVMVNDPDEAVRANRQAMLRRLQTLFAGVADLSVLSAA